MRPLALLLLALPLALAAGACSRSNLKGPPAEEGGGGSGGSPTTTTTTTSTTGPATCGDGVFDPFEECDDGNSSSQDACLPDCTMSATTPETTDPETQLKLIDNGCGCRTTGGGSRTSSS